MRKKEYINKWEQTNMKHIVTICGLMSVSSHKVIQATVLFHNNIIFLTTFSYNVKVSNQPKALEIVSGGLIRD